MTAPSARVGLASLPVLLLAALPSRPAAPPDALAGLATKAGKGDAQAQFELGRRLAAGEGVTRDDAASLRWFLKAAARGHTKAEASLGSLYAGGRGVKQDREESVRWYRKAARAGDPAAQYALGLAAARGHGLARDESAAAAWMRLAAEQGHPQAQLELGGRYERGEGVPRSDLDAFVLYSLASRHAGQARLFGESGAKEVVKKRDGVAGKLPAEQRGGAVRRIAAAEALAAVHPRRFGTAANVEKIRGWYIWRKFDPKTWEAEVAREQGPEVYKVRVLPWATTYRHLTYGARPDELLPGERVNLFFSADENHPRGYVTHFQDELGQMKGHGHAWRIRSAGARGFAAVAVASKEAVDGRELTFELAPGCRVWKGGKLVKGQPYAAGDRVLLTWALRGKQRIVSLVADGASLEAVRKEQAARTAKQIAAEGIACLVQTVEGGEAHVLVFATHWQQAGRLREKQVVTLRLAGEGLRPTGEGVAAEVIFFKNRGVYGSGPTDVVLRLNGAADAKRVRGWAGVVRLIAEP